MNPLFTCPAPAVLAAIPPQDCPVRWDQIVRMIIQRKQTTGLTDAGILLSATWTPLFAAVDDTKAIKSPLIPNVVIPPGEVLKEGGNDNTTINGLPKLAGLAFTAVTAEMQDASAEVSEAMRSWASESAINPGYTNLWAYFVNRFGQVICSHEDEDDNQGFPIYNFCVGDVGTEGFNKANINKVSFDLAPHWSFKHQMFTPTDINLLS